MLSSTHGISIYNTIQIFFPIMILIILTISSLEFTRLVKLLGAKINKYIFLSANLIIFANANHKFIETIDLLTIFFLIIFTIGMLSKNQNGLLSITYFIFGLFWLGICLSSTLIYIRYSENGMFFTYMLFLCTWICDTFAFVFGSI